MTTPVLARTRAQVADALAAHRAAGRKIGFVPTMGALHHGHASLVDVAREQVGDGAVVVSIFVNPMQFGPGEDLDRYPRTLEEDLALCAEAGVDVVFAPDVAEVYPGGEPVVTVDPGPLADLHEGRTRPGHFKGVLTVVAKLFGLVAPDVAVFGEKDYQQLTLIRRMVTDLCFGVKVVGAPTMREADGLARSSRNRYLDEEHRREAAVLNRTLRAAQNDAAYGVHAALDAARAELRASTGVDLDYLAICTPDLERQFYEYDTTEPETHARILIAARVGPTRLIDNLPLVLGGTTTVAVHAATGTTEGDS